MEYLKQEEIAIDLDGIDGLYEQCEVLEEIAIDLDDIDGLYEQYEVLEEIAINIINLEKEA